MTGPGAEAFTTYFFKQVNSSYKDAKPTGFDLLYTPTCKSCTGLSETVQQLADSKHRFNGDFVTPTNITIASITGAEAKTFVATQTPAHNVVDASGAVIKAIPAGVGNLSVFLTYAGQWRVTEIKTAG